jgi:polyphosphate kinase
MGRNLDRRVETIVPVLCPELRERITNDILGTLMQDDAQTRWLQADGTYVRRAPANGPHFNAQLTFLAAGRSALAREARDERLA